MKYVANKNGHVSKVSEAVHTEMDEVPEPPKDSVFRDGSVKYKYDRQADQYVEVQEDNRSVYQKILDKFVEWEANQSAALDRIDMILSSSPALQIALDEGNVEVVKDRLSQHQGNGLKKSEVEELIDLIT